MPIAEADPQYTLEQLQTKLATPDPALLAALLTDESRVTLTAMGADISSGRVLTDDARIYGQAYDAWSKMTPEKKAMLVGFTEPLLALAVQQALELKAKATAFASDKTTAKVGTVTRNQALAVAHGQALGLRDQAKTVLLSIASLDSALRAKVQGATGTADDADKIASGLERLAEIANDFLAHKADAIATRVVLFGLTPAFVDKITATAKALRGTAIEASAPRANMNVRQSDLDLLDGINLHLLDEIVRAFEAAHDLDPTIPRLVPIATRRSLGKHKKAKTATTSPTPTAPSATKTATTTPSA